MPTPDDLLAGLDAEQQAVARAVHGPVVVLAGAGTGKTRAVTHRIAYAVATGAHEARRSMAITFTTRAAGQMRTRLHDLGVQGASVRTFHAAALRQLRHFWPRLSRNEFPEIAAAKGRFLTQAASQVRITLDAATLRDTATDIEWCKVNQIDLTEIITDERARSRQWALPAQEFVRLFTAYEEIKTAQGFIDFEDVLLSTVATLHTRPDITQEVRTAYRWFTVDEFQDVSPLQDELLRLWLGDRDDLCAVGDANQTIYSFTGATSAFLFGFPNRFPDATVVRLTRCYRCTPQIVLAANALATDLPKGVEQGVLAPLVSMQQDGPPPQIHDLPDEVAEAEWVAQRIAGLVEGGLAPNRIAVLYRMNAQSVNLEAALADLGIPFSLRGAERFFERPEVRQALTLIRGSAVGETAPANLVDAVRGVLSTMGWSEQAPTGSGAVRERWESLAALVALAQERGTASLRAFVDELDRRAAVQDAPAAMGVTLCSLHAAKGLEWEAVFIIGMSEGLLPIATATTAEELAEERRLTYVGITRAARQLTLTWARSRQPGGSAHRRPSRFLSALTSQPRDLRQGGADSAVLRAGSGQARIERKQRRPAPCRVCGASLVTAAERTLGRCRTCPGRDDPELRERLREWRLAEANERQVPAYIVFTDVTLDAIVDRHPQTLDALQEIPGIGPAKLGTYGPALLALLARRAND
ncbi:MAG: ATP-dependent DNA helicase UvrD2 [Actinomycetales bacterium]